MHSLITHHLAVLALPTLIIASLTLCGCDGQGDIIDTIGSKVDPYAANVEAMKSQAESATNQPNETVEDVTSDVDAYVDEQDVIDDAPEASSDEDASQQPDYAADSHYEGEYVQVGDPTYGVNASWIRDGNGAWAAAFYTYNGTQINSYLVDGVWRYYTVNGREVYSSDSSLNYGQYGPSGIESYWRDAADPNIWY